MSNKYIRSDLKNLKPYKPNNMPYKIKLDANESVYDLPQNIRELLASELLEGMQLNLYPDSDASVLKNKLSSFIDASSEEILVGVGSDELINVAINTFVEKGDTVVFPTPSFSMYKFYCLIAGVSYSEVPLSDSFEYNVNNIVDEVNSTSAKMLILCSPNNPTGNVLNDDELKYIIDNTNCIIVIDQAYGEFSRLTVNRNFIDTGRVVYLKTFSKALGMAGLRIGYSVSSKENTRSLNIVKPPYNINTFSQKTACYLLDNIKLVKQRVEEIIENREELITLLSSLDGITTFKSGANFILFRCSFAEELFLFLQNQGILIRKFSNPQVENCLRVSIGSKKFNTLFFNSVLDFIQGGSEK